MGIRGASVAIAVSDRKAAARWYVESLGFRVFDDDPEHWTTVGDPSGSFLLHLCEVGGRPGKAPPRSEVGNTGVLLVTDEAFGRTCARLKRRGVRFSMAPKRMPWGWQAKFRDPDGNEFTLMPAAWRTG
jgi:catechol 2,3-dioxygenase-like lactoylglutathione lyase family enzyme